MPARRLLAAALSLVLATSACATTGQPTSASTTSAPGAPTTTQSRPSPTPTPTPTNQGVRKLSVADAEWVDVLRGGTKVKLAGGKAVDGEYSYQLGDVVYSDANGDKQEDLLAFITRTKSDGTAKTQAYIWLFDPKAKTVAQVADPVGEWWSCGSSLVSAKAGQPQGFEIGEKQRYWYDYQKCGTVPKHDVTRTIVVSQGRLTMTKPMLAYGGICYPTYSDPTVLTRITPIRVFPDAAAPVIENQRTVYSGIPDQMTRAWPEGWTQVQWRTDAMKADGLYVGICGFLWTK